MAASEESWGDELEGLLGLDEATSSPPAEPGGQGGGHGACTAAGEACREPPQASAAPAPGGRAAGPAPKRRRVCVAPRKGAARPSFAAARAESPEQPAEPGGSPAQLPDGGSACGLAQLTEALLLRICCFLSPDEINVLGCTSRLLRTVCQDAQLWRRLYFSRWAARGRRRSRLWPGAPGALVHCWEAGSRSRAGCILPVKKGAPCAHTQVAERPKERGGGGRGRHHRGGLEGAPMQRAPSCPPRRRPWLKRRRLPALAPCPNSIRCRSAMLGKHRGSTTQGPLQASPQPVLPFFLLQVVYMERDHQELSASLAGCAPALQPLYAQMATAKRSEALGAAHTEQLFRRGGGRRWEPSGGRGGVGAACAWPVRPREAQLGGLLAPELPLAKCARCAAAHCHAGRRGRRTAAAGAAAQAAARHAGCRTRSCSSRWRRRLTPSGGSAGSPTLHFTQVGVRKGVLEIAERKGIARPALLAGSGGLGSCWLQERGGLAPPRGLPAVDVWWRKAVRLD